MKTTANKINMTPETFIGLIPFDLDGDTVTLYLANLNKFYGNKIDGEKHLYIWQHVEAFKQSITVLHSDLKDGVLMSLDAYLDDFNFKVNEYINEQLLWELSLFEEVYKDYVDLFEPWQLNLAFARVIEKFVCEEVDNYEAN